LESPKKLLPVEGRELEGDFCAACLFNLVKYPFRPGGGGRLKVLGGEACSVFGGGDCCAAILAKSSSRPGGAGGISDCNGSERASPEGYSTFFMGSHETDLALLDDAGCTSVEVPGRSKLVSPSDGFG
jgi:hypothetical protein